MTQREFKAWCEVTASSEHKWTSDLCSHQNGSVLVYKGGRDGRYILVTKDGLLIAGEYTGALPHIGEALFTPKFSKQFTTKAEAVNRCIEVGGIGIAVAIIAGREA